MATPHLEARPGDIAERILLPGDPYRSKFIAENFLSEYKLVNDVRGALAYTGNYKGVKVSVLGTGMGPASIGIYAHELINEYKVKTLIRVGTCGAIQPEINLGDLVVAVAASTDSNFHQQFNLPGLIAPNADFGLLSTTKETADAASIACHFGNVVSSEIFYHDDTHAWKAWAKMGVLALEMEANALYLTAMRHRAHAMCLLTVSDSLVHHTQLSSEERELGLRKMITLALDTIILH